MLRRHAEVMHGGCLGRLHAYTSLVVEGRSRGIQGWNVRVLLQPRHQAARQVCHALHALHALPAWHTVPAWHAARLLAVPIALAASTAQ